MIGCTKDKMDLRLLACQIRKPLDQIIEIKNAWKSASASFSSGTLITKKKKKSKLKINKFNVGNTNNSQQLNENKRSSVHILL